jgi:DNA-directed RNA polymerase subunit RPC12/RpoP
MTAFKHHNAFPKEKDIQGHLFPHVCFDCKKSFKKPISEAPRLCPQCGGEMVRLSRKFSASTATDTVQWKKVQFLVEHGFFFQSIYEPTESGGQQRTSYPTTYEQAKEFVVAFKSQAVNRAA